MSALVLMLLLVGERPPDSAPRRTVILVAGQAHDEGERRALSAALMLPIELGRRDDQVGLVFVGERPALRVPLMRPSERAEIALRLSLSAVLDAPLGIDLEAGLNVASNQLLSEKKSRPTRDRVLLVAREAPALARLENMAISKLTSQGVELDVLPLPGTDPESRARLGTWARRTGGRVLSSEEGLEAGLLSDLAEDPRGDELVLHNGAFVVDALVRRLEIFTPSAEGPCRLSNPSHQTIEREDPKAGLKFSEGASLQHISMLRPTPGNWRLNCGGSPAQRGTLLVIEGGSLETEQAPEQPTLDTPIELVTHVSLPKDLEASALSVEAAVDYTGGHQDIELEPRGRGVWRGVIRTSTSGVHPIRVEAIGPEFRRAKSFRILVEPSCFYVERSHVRVQKRCAVTEISGRVLALGQSRNLVFRENLTAPLIGPDLIGKESIKGIVEIEAHLADGRCIHAALGPVPLDARAPEPPHSWINELAWRLGLLNIPVACAAFLSLLRRRHA
ncbi:MAG: hypothetical protein U1E65_04210 [Myxococcota bacterium]